MSKKQQKAKQNICSQTTSAKRPSSQPWIRYSSPAFKPTAPAGLIEYQEHAERHSAT